MKKIQVSGVVLLLTSVVVGGCSRGNDASKSDGGASPEPAFLCNVANTGLDAQGVVGLTQALTASVANLQIAKQKNDLRDIDLKGQERTHRSSRGTVSDFDAPWAHKDLSKDGIPGTSTARAYAELGLKHPNQVIVAVIDSGMDIDHEDLKANIWINEKEANGLPGVDDDGNGYVDDINGWNFLVDTSGKSVDLASLEMTRELQRLRALEIERDLTADELKELNLVKGLFTKQFDFASGRLKTRTEQKEELSNAIQVLAKSCNVDPAKITGKLVKRISTNDVAVAKAWTVAQGYFDQGRDLEWFDASIKSWNETLDYQLNLDFAVHYAGDRNLFIEKGYGNPDVKPVADEEQHSTHVAGIIGAVRNNVGADGKAIGIDGQAQNVKIMALRVVPNGDERDKDIANAIRYAADNGARVINMSFGKAISPNRKDVWDAIEYAGTKNVLLVHAAGNDATNNDVTPSFPNRFKTDGTTVTPLPNFLEVGASTQFPQAKLPADFTNFGKTGVDLFAPGNKILSTVPGNGYEEFSGTSMASPEIAGLAALILSQKDMSTLELRDLLMKSVMPMGTVSVYLPGTGATAEPKFLNFADMSVSGGIGSGLNAILEALKN